MIVQKSRSATVARFVVVSVTMGRYGNLKKKNMNEIIPDVTKCRVCRKDVNREHLLTHAKKKHRMAWENYMLPKICLDMSEINRFHAKPPELHDEYWNQVG